MRLTPTPRWRRDDTELFLLTPDLVTETYVGWLNDPEVGRFLESRFATHTLDSTRAYVASQLDHPDALFLGIRCHALGAHVGNIKIAPINRVHGFGEVGIMVGERAAWGRGIATRAIAIVGEIAAHELGLRKLGAGCYGGNTGSEKAFVRAGFVVEGVRPAHFLLDGKPEDMIVMGRLLG